MSRPQLAALFNDPVFVGIFVDNADLGGSFGRDRTPPLGDRLSLAPPSRSFVARAVTLTAGPVRPWPRQAEQPILLSESPSDRRRLIMKGQSLFDGWRPVRQQIFWKRARQRGALTGGSM